MAPVAASSERSNHRAGLQAITVFVLNRVLLVIENRIQTLVQMGYVVAAIEIVIDEDLPVAMDVESATVEVMKFADAEGGNAFSQAAEKVGERHCIIVEVDEDEALPGFDSYGNQTVLRAIKILDSFEFGHTFQRTVESVVPAMIRTVQDGGLAAGFGYDGGSVVATDVVKGAQGPIVTANNYEGFSSNCGRDESPGRLDLIGARD